MKTPNHWTDIPKVVQELLHYYSQEALAGKLRVSTMTISRWKDSSEKYNKPNYPTYKYMKQMLNGLKAREKGQR